MPGTRFLTTSCGCLEVITFLFIVLQSMFEKVPRKTKLEALKLEAEGATQMEIATKLSISESTIQRAKSNQQRYGDIERLSKKHRLQGKITPRAHDVITFDLTSNVKKLLSMVFAVPDAHLDKYTGHLFDLLYIKLTRGELSHFLKKENISLKKVCHNTCLNVSNY